MLLNLINQYLLQIGHSFGTIAFLVINANYIFAMDLKHLNRSLLLSLIKEDQNENNNVKEKLIAQDHKVQQLLFWSNIGALWSYLMLIFIILRIYGSMYGSHSNLFVGLMIFMWILFAIYTFAIRDSMAYKICPFKKASKTFINYQIFKIAGRRKLVSIYLLIYAFILLTATIFFLFDTQNGLTTLLKITTPVTMLTFISGIYFIISLTRQKNKLDVIETQIDELEFREKIIQN